jgi:hypothetical protein
MMAASSQKEIYYRKAMRVLQSREPISAGANLPEPRVAMRWPLPCGNTRPSSVVE